MALLGNYFLLDFLSNDELLPIKSGDYTKLLNFRSGDSFLSPLKLFISYITLLLDFIRLFSLCSICLISL